MSKRLDPESPEWWRAAARRLPKNSAVRVYCRIMAADKAGAGKVLLSNDECFELAGDDAVQTAASNAAYEVMT